jgi:hypothetical protein
MKLQRIHAPLVAELKRQAPGLDVVASLPGDWDSLKAADIANDTLERNPDLVAIFCANDDMTLGAVEAARSKGKDKVVVIGVDGTQSALKSIRANRLNASVAQLPYLMGIRAVEDSRRALAGEKLPEFVDVPTLVLTGHLPPFAAERLKQLEVGARSGARRWERSPDRLASATAIGRSRGGWSVVRGLLLTQEALQHEELGRRARAAGLVGLFLRRALPYSRASRADTGGGAGFSSAKRWR